MNPKTLGERLRKGRLDLGLTQEELARRLVLSSRTIGTWEQDRSLPLGRQGPAVRALLGVDFLPVPGDLAAGLRASRLRLGLTQEDLAHLAGVHVRTVRNCEKGGYHPSRATLARLERVLGVQK